MPYRDIGPKQYKQGKAVATLSLSPMSDRAAIIRRIKLANVSAKDTWIIETTGRRVGRFLIDTLGNQQLLSAITSTFPKTKDIFDYLKTAANLELIYPVPQGCTTKVYSVGGATADIELEYTEQFPSEVTPALMNHPTGNRFVGPLYGVLPSSVTAIGDTAFASGEGLDWVPNVFLDNTSFQGWRMSILGLFLEAAGVNAYASTTDHQSYTDHLALQLNGTSYFSRDLPGGIPMIGKASAAGSVNTVYDSTVNALPPFQDTSPYDYSLWDTPMMMGPADKFLWRVNIAGDVGAGANYSHAYAVAIIDVTETGA